MMRAYGRTILTADERTYVRRWTARVLIFYGLIALCALGFAAFARQAADRTDAVAALTGAPGDPHGSRADH